MKEARWIVAAVILFFAWRGAALNLQWPQPDAPAVRIPQPSAENLAWAEPVRKILPRMSPADRRYLAHFYDATAFVLLRDADRDRPIISDTTKFEAFHAGSLDLAIDRKDVGKYDGLGAAIDEVYLAAAGANVQDVTPEVRAKLVAASGVLAWTFTIHGE